MSETLRFSDISVYIAPIERLDGESRRDAERRTALGLIRDALGPSVTVDHHPSGAPCLRGNDLSVSISHSLHYAAIAISPSGRVGIDIEEQRPQLRRVAPRVLSADELAAYSVSDDLLLSAWTLKEALYKAALTPGLDFRRDIRLPLPPTESIAHIGETAYSCKVVKAPEYTIALAMHNARCTMHDARCTIHNARRKVTVKINTILR